MEQDALELVRQGFAAASRGEVEPIAAMLAPDVRWHGAGDDGGGCQDRDQALRWMREAIDRGIRVELLEARELSGDRVLVLLQRSRREDEPEPPAPHGQIVSLRDGQVAEMVVYPTAEEALAAAAES